MSPRCRHFPEEPDCHEGNRVEISNIRRTKRRQPRQLRQLPARFIRSTVAPDLDTSLCSCCRLIDFAAMFKNSHMSELDGAVIAQIDVENDPIALYCRLCRFLNGLARDTRITINNIGSASHYWKLCSFDSLIVRGIPRTKTRLSKPRSIVLTVLLEDAAWIRDPKSLLLIVSDDYTDAPTHAQDGFSDRGKQLRAKPAHYDVATSWLQDCEEAHERCRLDVSKQKPARLIDCLCRKIVASALDMNSFALSYVVGNQPVQPPPSSCDSQGDNLPREIPQTLADAIDLVISLGYRYLWFDRWCINQVDPEEKHQQISCMVEVY